MRRLLLVLLLALAIPAAAAAAPLPNACTLVPEAQLSSALGGKVKHDAPRVTNGARMCVWQRTTFAVGAANPQLTLEVQPLAKDKFTSKWGRPIPGVRRVPGVGEMAYAINGGVWLVAWARGIEVTVNTTDLKAPLATATRVAKTALARL